MDKCVELWCTECSSVVREDESEGEYSHAACGAPLEPRLALDRIRDVLVENAELWERVTRLQTSNTAEVERRRELENRISKLHATVDIDLAERIEGCPACTDTAPCAACLEVVRIQSAVKAIFNRALA